MEFELAFFRCSVQKRRAVEVRHRRDTIHLTLEMLELLVGEGTFHVSHSVGRRLDAQLAHPEQDVGNLVDTALCRLYEGDTVVGVPVRLLQAANAAFQFFRDRETGRIVTGFGDTSTARHFRKRQRLFLVRDPKVSLSVQRVNVGCNTKTHDNSSSR
ncbi:MAG: hypothetical protein HUU38_29090 [Anaerolineales bacterium]|nr:hypothetical protein [Anaerolineales bacterium]